MCSEGHDFVSHIVEYPTTFLEIAGIKDKTISSIKQNDHHAVIVNVIIR